jgi:hypothetical protein
VILGGVRYIWVAKLENDLKKSIEKPLQGQLKLGGNVEIEIETGSAVVQKAYPGRTRITLPMSRIKVESPSCRDQGPHVPFACPLYTRGRAEVANPALNRALLRAQRLPSLESWPETQTDLTVRVKS